MPTLCVNTAFRFIIKIHLCTQCECVFLTIIVTQSLLVWQTISEAQAWPSGGKYCQKFKSTLSVPNTEYPSSITSHEGLRNFWYSCYRIPFSESNFLMEDFGWWNGMWWLPLYPSRISYQFKCWYTQCQCVVLNITITHSFFQMFFMLFSLLCAALQRERLIYSGRENDFGKKLWCNSKNQHSCQKYKISSTFISLPSYFASMWSKRKSPRRDVLLVHDVFLLFEFFENENLSESSGTCWALFV